MRQKFRKLELDIAKHKEKIVIQAFWLFNLLYKQFLRLDWNALEFFRSHSFPSQSQFYRIPSKSLRSWSRSSSRNWAKVIKRLSIQEATIWRSQRSSRRNQEHEANHARLRRTQHPLDKCFDFKNSSSANRIGNRWVCTCWFVFCVFPDLHPLALTCRTINHFISIDFSFVLRHCCKFWICSI